MRRDARASNSNELRRRILIRNPDRQFDLVDPVVARMTITLLRLTVGFAADRGDE